jgi:hypothetical protein
VQAGSEVAEINAQVGERLKPTDCKSVLLLEFGGSNPPLCTSYQALSRAVLITVSVECLLAKRRSKAPVAREKRFWVAMGVFVVLGVLEWTTLSNESVKVVNGPDGEPLFDLSIRGIALGVLVLFAFRTWIHERRALLEEKIERGSSREE